MAEKQAIFNLKVNTQGSEQAVDGATKSLKGYKDQVKQAETANQSFDDKLKSINKTVDSGNFTMRGANKLIQEYQAIAIQAGRTSPVGQEALKQAAMLQDKVTDLRNEVTRLAKDGQGMQQALAIGQGVVAGYTAFKGVTALLGVENEELMKTMVKMQAAQSVLMSIEQIRASLEKESVLMMGVKNIQTKAATAGTWAYAAAQKALNLATGAGSQAMKIFRLALISTGIGAIVVGLGMLIANLDSVGNFFKKVGSYIADFFRPQVEAVIKVLQFLGIVESDEEKERQKREDAKLAGLEKERAAREKNLKEMDKAHKKFADDGNFELRLMAAQGKSKDEIRKKEEELRKQILQNNFARGKEIQAINDTIIAETKLKKLRGEITNEEIKEANAAIEANNENIRALNSENKKIQQDMKIDSAKATTEMETEVTNIRKKASEDRIKQREEEAKKQIELQKTLEDLIIANIDDDDERKAAAMAMAHKREREQLVAKFGEDTALLKQLEEKQQGEIDVFKLSLEEKQKAEQKLKDEAARNEEILKLENDLMNMETDFKIRLEQELALEKVRRDALLQGVKEGSEEQRKILLDYDAKKAEINQKEIDREAQVAEAINASKMSILTASIGIVNQLGQLGKQGGAFAKAMALTEIAANTAIGFAQGLVIAQKGAAATGPAAPFAFPTFFATQVGAVLSAANQARKILGTAPNISGVGGGGGAGAPSVSAPSVNSRDFNEGNLTGGEDNQTMKVAVLESDITRTQTRIQDIAVRSTI
jgi:hypothetical protein